MPFTKSLDVIQQAQSGTGKTATFCAGILNNLDYQNLECQVRMRSNSTAAVGRKALCFPGQLGLLQLNSRHGRPWS